jgi:branched-chain amino acid transport system substrate-binding protein
MLLRTLIKKRRRRDMKRRCLLILGKIIFLFLLSSLSLQINNVAAAEEKKGPIKIGMNMELTGILSETSTNVKMGYDLYLQEIGYKVAGREIKVIEYDNKSDYKIAMEVAQKLSEKDNVHMMGFGTGTGAALALRGYAEKMKVPFVVLGMAGGEQITLPPLKYTFRLSYADGQGEPPIGLYAYEKLGCRKMVLMGTDSPGGTGKLWAFQQAFEKSGGTIVQTVLWPIGDMDLSPYFARLKPDFDGIFPFIPGDISINRFYSQYFEMQLDKKGKKLCTHWGMTEDYLPLQTFGEKMLGITSVAFYNLNFDTPENKHFTDAYYAKYGKKKLTNDQAAAGYESMKFLCAALDAIKGNAEDTEAFLKAMHQIKIKGICSSLISVDANGNVIRDFFIREVQKKDGIVKNVVLRTFPQVQQPPQGSALMPGKGK